MNILGGLLGRYGEPVSLSEMEYGVRRAVNKTQAGTFVNEYLALNLTAVSCAVQVIANTMAQLPVHVYQRTSKGREPVNQHPVEAMLNVEANANMTPFTFKQTKQSHALLWGNGYGEIVRNGRGQAVGLELMEPDRTRPEEKEPGRIVYGYNGMLGKADLPSSEVLHLKALGYNGLVGYSQIQMHRNALGLALAAEQFGSKFFANDAKSGGFLQHPGKLGEQATKNLQDSQNKQGGLDNAFKVKILEEGMKFIQTTIPPDDAQFLGTREFQNAEVARMYNVPLILLHSHEKTTSWGSGIEELILGFVRFTLQSWIVADEQEMNRKLFTPKEREQGLFVKYALGALLRGDMASRAAFYKTMAEISGLTANEIRELEDRNPLPGLDRPYMPTNWQHVDQSGKGTQENEQ